jgi:hypothetical protein
LRIGQVIPSLWLRETISFGGSPSASASSLFDPLDGPAQRCLPTILVLVISIELWSTTMPERILPERMLRGSKRRVRKQDRPRARRRRLLESLESRCLLASLGGEVFLDSDGDGQKGTSEFGAPGVQVYIDANDNRVLDAGELTAQTDALGQYLFTGLPAADYVVRLNAMPGQTQTAPTGFLGTGYTSVGDGSGTNPTQLYEMSLAGDVTPIGSPTGTRIHDLVRTFDDELFGVSFQTDGIYTLDPVTGQETLLGLSSAELVAGLAYDPQGDVVYTVADDGTGLVLQSVDQLSGQTVNVAAGVRAINFGSTFFDFDPATGVAVAILRQPSSPFASTLDARSDGVIFGLQGSTLHQYEFPSAGSTATAISTLSQTIESISFGAGDQLFGVTTGSTFHPIDVSTGTVGQGVSITFNGAAISGITGFDIAPDGTHYLVDSTHLYRFDPVSGIATQAPNRALPPFSPIFSSLSVNGDGELFATLFNTTTPLAQIDPVSGLATRLGNDPLGAPYAAVVTPSNQTRLTGLPAVSDLTFDTVNRRIVGYDNNTNRFFQFTPDGTAKMLATASRPLDSWSLAFDGTDFVMFDQGDVNRTQTVRVNPDTGEVSNGFVASQRIPTEGLFHAKTGNTAHRLSVAANDALADVDFGLDAPALAIDPFEPYPLVINEVLVGFQFGANADKDQALEFRGEPGGVIADGTYFVIVDENDTNMGEVHGIFDLSNQPLGANGFLTILQQDSIHPVDPDSAVLQSTSAGFGGLPGGIYTDSHPLTNRIDFVLGPNAYFLIQTDTPPQLGDDIDADDDGLADRTGIKSNWTVLDSLSLHPDNFADGQAYGEILLSATNSFGNDPESRTVEFGTPIVVADGFGYAGRIGDSVGSSPDDWVFGTPAVAAVDGNNRTTLFELDAGFFGWPMPRAFQRRDLNHFGDSNFVGGIRGKIDVDYGTGLPEPAVGMTVLADINNNGVQDLLSNIVDPDEAVDFQNLIDPNGNENRFPLVNTYDGVTITAVNNNLNPLGSAVETVRETINFVRPTNNFIFSAQGLDTFSTLRRLRFDFYRPVSEASIVAIGSEFGLTPARGTILAYDAKGNLIDSEVSNLLTGSTRETIRVASPNNDIAYVIAYSDDSQPNITSGRFDRFSFKQLEPTAITDASGQFEIKNLFPSVYNVSVLKDAQSNNLLGRPPQPFFVQRYENYLFTDTLRPNNGPIVDSQTVFTIDENVPPGTTIGFIPATDIDNQPLTFGIIGGSSSGLVIDPATGELKVGPAGVVDFESVPQINFVVEVSDSFESASTFVTVRVNDLNEPPVVADEEILVSEGTPVNTAVGQIEAFDPDFQQNQSLSYTLLGGTGVGVFAVDPVTGLIRVLDPAAINFQSAPVMNLLVRVADNGVPQAFTEVDQVIRVVDENDPPEITTTQFFVAENSSGFIGQLGVLDLDPAQSHSFQLTGGTGQNFFAVDRFGAISVRPGATLDFEQIDTYTLNVLVIDNGTPPLAGSATVTITVTDVEEPPTLAQSTVQLPENSPAGTPVTTIQVVDPEGRSASNYSVALLPQGDAASFDFDPVSNVLTVADGADLNFEAQVIHTLTFEVTDAQQIDPITRLTFTVQLQDVNDPPSLLTTSVVVSELALPGAVVGKVEVQVNEPDVGDTVFADIVGGNAAGLFTLDRISRVLRVAPGATFDADDPNAEPLQLEILLTDSQPATSLGTIDVILNNVNEPPVINVPPLSRSLDSGQELRLVIDPDDIVDPEGDPYKVTIFDANGSLLSWLSFDPVKFTLTGLASPLDIGSYPLTLRAFQPGLLQLFSDESFVVEVQRGTTPLTNRRDPLDVDANGQVAPLDALRVINFIGRYGSGASVLDDDYSFTGFVDTSGDGFVTARDGLLVINGLVKVPGIAGEFVAAHDEESEIEALDRALRELLSESGLF